MLFVTVEHDLYTSESSLFSCSSFSLFLSLPPPLLLWDCSRHCCLFQTPNFANISAQALSRTPVLRRSFPAVLGVGCDGA